MRVLIRTNVPYGWIMLYTGAKLVALKFLNLVEYFSKTNVSILFITNSVWNKIIIMHQANIHSLSTLHFYIEWKFIVKLCIRKYVNTFVVSFTFQYYISYFLFFNLPCSFSVYVFCLTTESTRKPSMKH